MKKEKSQKSLNNLFLDRLKEELDLRKDLELAGFF